MRHLPTFVLPFLMLCIVAASATAGDKDKIGPNEVAGADISSSEFVTDKLLELVPPGGKFFKDFLLNERQSVKLAISIPESRTTDGNNFPKSPLIDTPGTVSGSMQDGHFFKFNVSTIWVANGSPIPEAQKAWHAGGEVRDCQLMLTVAYKWPDGSATLIAPVSVVVWRDKQEHYGHSRPVIDYEHAIIMVQPAAQ